LAYFFILIINLTLIAQSPDWLGLIMKLLIASGLRISELLGIKLRNVRKNGDSRSIRIRGKGNKERKIEVDGNLLKAIRKEFEGVTYLFEDKDHKPFRREMVSMSIKRLGLKVLYKNISAHTLRHSFATAMYRKDRENKSSERLFGTSVFKHHTRYVRSSKIEVIKSDE
jgi:integrase